MPSGSVDQGFPKGLDMKSQVRLSPWYLMQCVQASMRTVISSLYFSFPAHADAPLALPAQPESSSVVLVWTCDQTGRSSAGGAEHGAQRLHEDHPRQDAPGDRQGFESKSR